MADSPENQPNIVQILNNLGNLYKAINEFSKAESASLCAKSIRERLTQQHPSAYTLGLEMTLLNMGLFYKYAVVDREKSIVYCQNCMLVGRPPTRMC